LADGITLGGSLNLPLRTPGSTLLPSVGIDIRFQRMPLPFSCAPMAVKTCVPRGRSGSSIVIGIFVFGLLVSPRTGTRIPCVRPYYTTGVWQVSS
jgi:hypothetical protein